MAGEIRANKAKYIKLGRRGLWEEECLLHENTIKIGFNNPLHKECLEGNWEKVHQYWVETGESSGEATKITNQLKAFYESGEEVLWVTFFNNRLYWGFAEKEVRKLSDGTRVRKIKNGWKSQDIKGEPLTIYNLSGKLTQVRNFRGTICRAKELDYVVRRINHLKMDYVQQAEKTYSKLLEDIEPLIQNLTWKDFELLVDLIFTHAGWQRISQLGGKEKSIDLALMSPVTGDRAFVQVKSKSTREELDEYISKYQDMEEFDEMFFVVHTNEKPFVDWINTNDIKVWGVSEIAKLVVDSGLTSWLIKKTT